MEIKNIYRKKAVESLSSDMCLDSGLSIVKPKYWFALLGGVILLLTAFLWGIFGSVNSTTDCYGFYYTIGYSNTYFCDGNGVVSSIYKISGDFVSKGEALYTYQDKQSKDFIEVKSEVTGVIIKNEIFPGCSFFNGQKAYTIRTFLEPSLYGQSIYSSNDFGDSSRSYYDFEKIIYLTVPFLEIAKIKPGEEVIVKPLVTSSGSSFKGVISNVGSSIATEKDFDALFGSPLSEKSNELLTNTIICECKITDTSGIDNIGYQEGDTVWASIITGQTNPLSLLFSKILSN